MIWDHSIAGIEGKKSEEEDLKTSSGGLQGLYAAGQSTEN